MVSALSLEREGSKPNDFKAIQKTRKKTSMSIEDTAKVPTQLSVNEMLIQSIKMFRDEIRSVTAKAETEHEQSISDAKERIEHAEHFVKETGLNYALLLMLKEMWHWPSHSKSDDWAEYININLSEVSGEEFKGKDKDSKRVNFIYSGQKYRFEFDKDNGDFEGSIFGAIRLYHNDELVVSIEVVHDDIDKEYDDWDYMTVDGLKIGSWVGHIVEIEEKLRLEKKKYLMNLNAELILKQAKNLPEKE